MKKRWPEQGRSLGERQMKVEGREGDMVRCPVLQREEGNVRTGHLALVISRL